MYTKYHDNLIGSKHLLKNLLIIVEQLLGKTYKLNITICRLHWHEHAIKIAYFRI